MTHRLKGYRTLGVAVATAIFGFLEVTDLTEVIPPEKLPYVVIAIGLINVILRIQTTTPVGRRE